MITVNKIKASKTGFTLLEVLLALIIMSIVVSIVLYNYRVWVRKTQAAEAKEVLIQLSKDTWQHHVEAGDFPGFTGDFTVQPPNSQYFTYVYDPVDVSIGAGIWSARYINAGGLKPNDTWVYFIAYRITPPPGFAATSPFQKVDDNWTRYYGYMKRNAVRVWTWD